MAQLARIRTMMEWEWGLREDSQENEKESEEESGDDKEGSKNGPRESQKKVEEVG